MISILEVNFCENKFVKKQLVFTDKTKLKLDREVGGGCFFLFQVFRCFINLVAKQFDVLFVCVSVCVFHSLFLFLSGDLSSRLWRRLTDGC